MLRRVVVLFACVAALGLAVPAGAVPDTASAPGAEPVKAKRVAPAKAKRRSGYSKDYGFLPGYEPPPKRPLYGPSDGYFDNPRFWYAGRYYWGWGGPRFYRGRWNGGGFGPCWTQTPIGPVWNCGR